MVRKSIRKYAKVSVLLLLAIVLMLGQSLVMAQTSTNEVEIVGRATALTAQTITIGTQTFDITQTEVKAGVAVGELVKVHASQNAAGQWIAREVELAQQPVLTGTLAPEVTPDPTLAAGEFEIKGQITALTSTTIVVGGHIIDISNAEIKNALSLNERVKVHVSVVNGVWIAREVEAASVVTIPATGTLTVTPRHNDDGPGHDDNDDHGNHGGQNNNGNGNNGNDDHGNHGGNGGNSGSGNNGNDDHGNRGGSGNSGSGSSHGGGSDDHSGHG